jgi:hypothetical protein
VSQVLSVSILTFAAIAGLGNIAHSADLYPPYPEPGAVYSPAPAYNWTAFYPVANTDYAWSVSKAGTALALATWKQDSAKAAAFNTPTMSFSMSSASQIE